MNLIKNKERKIRVHLQCLFGIVTPETLFTCHYYDSRSGKTHSHPINSDVKRIEVPHLLEKGYSSEMEFLLLKQDKNWLFQADFNVTTKNPQCFSVVLRGKGIYKELKVDPNIIPNAGFEIPFHVPWETLWVQI